MRDSMSKCLQLKPRSDKIFDYLILIELGVCKNICMCKYARARAHVCMCRILLFCLENIIFTQLHGSAGVEFEMLVII